MLSVSTFFILCFILRVCDFGDLTAVWTESSRKGVFINGYTVYTLTDTRVLISEYDHTRVHPSEYDQNTTTLALGYPRVYSIPNTRLQVFKGVLIIAGCVYSGLTRVSSRSILGYLPVIYQAGYLRVMNPGMTNVNRVGARVLPQSIYLKVNPAEHTTVGIFREPFLSGWLISQGFSFPFL